MFSFVLCTVTHHSEDLLRLTKVTDFFLCFQYVDVSMTLILRERKRFFIFSYLYVGIFGYCFLLEADVQHVLGAEIGPMLSGFSQSF